jgi:hypothetical protein
MNFYILYIYEYRTMVSTPDFAVKEISMTTMQDKGIDAAGIICVEIFIYVNVIFISGFFFFKYLLLNIQIFYLYA